MSPPWTSRDRLSERHRIPARAGPSLPSRVRRGWVVTTPSPRQHIGPGRVVILPPSFSLPPNDWRADQSQSHSHAGLSQLRKSSDPGSPAELPGHPWEESQPLPTDWLRSDGVSSQYRVPGISAGRLATRAGRRHCGA